MERLRAGAEKLPDPEKFHSFPTAGPGLFSTAFPPGRETCMRFLCSLGAYLSCCSKSLRTRSRSASLLRFSSMPLTAYMTVEWCLSLNSLPISG